MSRTHFRMNLSSICLLMSRHISLNVKEFLARNRRDIWSLSNCIRTEIYNYLLCKGTLEHFAKDWAESRVLISTVHLITCSYHVTYAFQSESTRHISMNVKELLARSRRDIWKLSDCNETRDHMVKLTKWLIWVVITYWYGGFGCMFSSYLVHVSEWIHTLYLPECQRIPCYKQAQYVKFKRLKRNSNRQPLRSQSNTQPFGQTEQTI